MIPESASPTVFGLLTRNFNVALEVGVIKPWLKKVGAISFTLGPGRDLPMSPPQHCVVVGVRLDTDAEDLSYTLCPIFL